MMKNENPQSRMRCALSQMLTKKGVSMYTQAEITVCMCEKTDEEKEKLAEQLIEIVSTSKTEQEMILKSQKLI